MPDDSLKSRAGFSPEQETDHLTELIAGQGTICHNDAGEVQIHFHGLFSDKGFLRGGHFDQPGNIIGTTMEIAIQEVEGVSMTRPFDEEIDQNHLDPVEVAIGWNRNGVERQEMNHRTRILESIVPQAAGSYSHCTGTMI